MPRWTPQSRAAQRALISRVKPWESSTGPRTPRGKAESARNGPQHPPRRPGEHPEEVRRQIRQWRKMLRLHLDCPVMGGGLIQGVALKIYALEVATGKNPETVANELIDGMRKRLK